MDDNIVFIPLDLLDSHQQQKAKRILEVARTLRRLERTDYKEFLAKLQFRGIRKIVAIEYLDALRDLKRVKIDKSDIVWSHETDYESSTYLDQRPR